MSILKIYKYPHPILREKCAPVPVLEDGKFSPEIQTLIADMIETMYAGNGAVGLAAPQVGTAVRIVVIDVAAKEARDQLKVLVNPEIIQQSRNKMVREGCLSFPEYLANIKRSLRCTVRCLNERAELVEHQVEGLESIAVQHELDHLEGVLLIDRVNSLKTDLIRRRALPPRDSEAGDEIAEARVREVEISE